MIVSWNWLKQHVDLKMTHDELVDRLTMSGLNHEGTTNVDGDKAIDLEVTSNRPDCLGHIGVAREIAVLFDLPLKIDDPTPIQGNDDIAARCQVEIQCPELCKRYTARLIRGVKIGTSPDWMLDRLETIGVTPVNNVVDITNYVMFECSQPLHAFDFAKVTEGKIIVRHGMQSNGPEEMEAIDHKSYELLKTDCIIADPKAAIAIGGVMGGADSEINDKTTDVLIEAAYFDQLAIRNTARRLKLFSPSSFRFERDINSANIDWASRRACQLILEFAGGELCQGVVDVGEIPAPPNQIKLRLDQIERLLGIQIDAETSVRILAALGLSIDNHDAKTITATPPSWRKDLTREVDLIEEVGRVHGYQHIPDDSSVPMSSSIRQDYERSINRVRSILTASGYDEAITASVIPEPWSTQFSPWCEHAAHQISQPMLGVLEKASQNVGAVDRLRRSIVPSLLEVRRINEYKFNTDVHLFETARVYLPSSKGLPEQPWKIALVSDGDFFDVKGAIETLTAHMNPGTALSSENCDEKLLDPDRSCQLLLGKEILGVLGEVSEAGKRAFGLRRRATICEIDFKVLAGVDVLIPQFQPLSHYPPVSRDFNMIVDNTVRWADLESSVRQASGDLLEDVSFKEIFRDPAKDGEDKKRVLLSIVLRSNSDTLTGDEAEKVSQSIIDTCYKKHGAALVT